MLRFFFITQFAYLLFFSNCLSLVDNAQAKELPNFVPRCNINASNFKECIVNATETMRPYLKKGIPQINLPSCEPLVIPQMALEQNSQGGSYKCSFMDFALNGLTKYKFSGFEYDLSPNGLHLLLNFTFDDITIKSKYVLDGKILMIPIHGDGTFTGKINKAYGMIEFFMDFINKDDVKYLHINNTKIDLKLSKNNKIHFDRLIQGNAIITEATRLFFRDNVDLILEEVLPSIEYIINELIKQFGHNVLSAFPYKSLFDGN